MTRLNIEAENYLKKWDWPEDVNGIDCFIAGATSNYVQQEKLQFLIEQLNELEFNPKENIVDFALRIKNKIAKLEEQLKQLEDENVK